MTTALNNREYLTVSNDHTGLPGATGGTFDWLEQAENISFDASTTIVAKSPVSANFMTKYATIKDGTSSFDIVPSAEELAFFQAAQIANTELTFYWTYVGDIDTTTATPTNLPLAGATTIGFKCFIADVSRSSSGDTPHAMTVSLANTGDPVTFAGAPA